MTANDMYDLLVNGSPSGTDSIRWIQPCLAPVPLIAGYVGRPYQELCQVHPACLQAGSGLHSGGGGS